MAILAFPYSVRDSANASTDNRKSGLTPTVSVGKTLAASPASVTAAGNVTVVEIGSGDYIALYDPEANGDASFPIDWGASLTNPNDRYSTLILTRDAGRILGSLTASGANTVQFAGQAITATAPVTIPASIGTSTYAGGAVASVTGNVGGNVAGSVGAVSSSVAANVVSVNGSTFIGTSVPTSGGTVNLGASAPAGWINSAAFAAGATIPRVTLADTVTTYTGNTPQSGDAFARIGANGGGLTSVALSASGLNNIAGWGAWNIAQTIKAAFALLGGKRSGMPASGAAGTITFVDNAATSYGSVAVDTSGNITTSALTPP